MGHLEARWGLNLTLNSRLFLELFWRVFHVQREGLERTIHLTGTNGHRRSESTFMLSLGGLSHRCGPVRKRHIFAINFLRLIESSGGCNALEKAFSFLDLVDSVPMLF